MEIIRSSPRTGIENTMDLDITQEQIDAYNSGEYAQVAFSNLNAEEREFFMTGYTAEDWDTIFPEEEEDQVNNVLLN